MTVAELIAALTEMPQDLEVYTEGCDCTGDVGSVDLEDEGYGEPARQTVMLARKVCICDRKLGKARTRDPDCPVHGD